MPSTALTAQIRTDLGKKVDRLRRKTLIPGVVYGHNIPSRPLTVEANAFEATLKHTGATGLVDLTVDQDQPVKVLIHDVQRHPTTGRPIHADFYQVKMTEKLEADIDLNFIGESPAVKEQGGILIRTINQVKVSCLPADLVAAIDVDISILKTFEDRIHLSDVVLPPGLTILMKGDEVVASVIPPRSEDELASLSAKVEEDVEAVEVTKKVKAEDETATDDSAVSAGEKPSPTVSAGKADTKK